MSLLLGACRMKSGLGCGQPTSLSFGACRLQGRRGLQPRRHARAYASAAILMCVAADELGRRPRSGASGGSVKTAWLCTFRVTLCVHAKKQVGASLGR